MAVESQLAGHRVGLRAISAWVAVPVLAAMLAWLLWYPMRGASAYLDDYLFLALGRHVETPWPLLVNDSVGIFFYRPLSMFLWAVSVEAFGTAAPPHLALNMVVHAANGALLYALARGLGVGRAGAALGAVLFIAHPTTFSAAAWLSDRFDILSLFFGLAGLIAIERFVVRPRGATFAAACLAMAASFLSKEIGFGLVPAALLMLAVVPMQAAASRAQRAALAMGIVTCAALVIAARFLVLRNVADTMFLSGGPVATLLGGFGHWLRYLPAFLAVRHGSTAAMAVQGLLVLAPLLALGVPAARAGLRSRQALRILLVALFIAGGAVGAQSPVVNASPIVPYGAGGFNFDSLAGSRFYYVAFAGFALAAAVIAGSLVPVVSRLPALRLAACAIAIVAVWGMLAASRTIGREWTAFVDSGDVPLLRSAIETVKAQRDAPPGCKIYLLDLPKSAYGLRAMLDVGVKQGLPRHDPHVACFIQAEHAPWYNLLEARALAPDANLPLEIMLFNGKPYPPLRVANLEYFYLKSTNVPAIVADPKATFYAFDGKGFTDVTAQVRDGSRPMKFYDNRPLF